MLVLALHDGYFYAVHRMLHRPWWFARVHSWHHRSIHPTPWAAYAFHPGEAVLVALFLPLVMFLIPLHSAVIGAFLVLIIVRNHVGHCGVEVAPAVRLGRLYARYFATTVHHHQHHQFGRGNYGLYLRFLDQWFRTERADFAEPIARFVEPERPETSTALAQAMKGHPNG